MDSQLGTSGFWPKKNVSDKQLLLDQSDSEDEGSLFSNSSYFHQKKLTIIHLTIMMHMIVSMKQMHIG